MKTEDKNISQLKNELSQEWNKPKAQNIKEKYDKREARSYNEIKNIQKQINKIKKKARKKKINYTAEQNKRYELKKEENNG